MKRELIKLSIRVDKLELERLNTLTGLNESSKSIRAAINFTNNVAFNLFGGNLTNMFKRRKGNEELDCYENP